MYELIRCVNNHRVVVLSPGKLACIPVPPRGTIGAIIYRVTLLFQYA